MSVHPSLAPVLVGVASAPWAGLSIRVVLAVDHARMRRTLRLLLDGEDDVEVVADAGDLSTVVRHVHDYGPRVLVIDLGMSNGSSMEAIRRLREDVPSTDIVVLTMEESRVFAQEALDAGAIGFVLKQAADAELPVAVRRAARGQHYLSPAVAARLASMAQPRPH